MSNDRDNPEQVSFRDVAPAIEFVCWIVVLLCPLLWLANGPAVTNDQFVIQASLFAMALVGGLSLRLYHVFRR